jgi:photosystem II stability/assembly factor-like uncharacterized protein
MKIYLAILIIFFLIPSAFSQWSLQNSGTTQILECVYFADSLHGWVGTNLDTILRTTNGGDNWVKISTNTKEEVSKIFFINKDTGWCTSYSDAGNGIICKSTDGGLTWVKKHDAPITLQSIYFTNQNIGWAVGTAEFVGGEVLKTTNGGDTWKLNYLFGNDPIHPYKILFTNEETGFVVGGEPHGRVFKTTNSGIQWHEIQVEPSNIYDTFLDISFSDPQNGLICSLDGRLYRSNDEGENWNEVYTGKGSFYAVVDRKPRYWIAGGQSIFSSTDAGVNWFIQYKNKVSFTGMSFVNDSLGWAVGTSGNYDSLIILKTVNGGVPIQGDPEIPTLIEPANNSQINYYPLIFSWNELQLSAYELELSLDSLFNNIEKAVTIFDPYYYYGTLKNYSQYYWRVRSKNLNGFSMWSDTFKFTTGNVVLGITKTNELKYGFELMQNYPNPFNPETKIRYTIVKSAFVKIKVFDLLGREVTSLINGYQSSGVHETKFNASGFTSGIYIYSIFVDGALLSSKKMLFMK